MKTICSCPNCDCDVRIKVYGCPECGTEIHGDFDVNCMLKLNQEDMEYMFLFLAHRGNLTEVARVTGVSYPTAKNRFEAFLERIGLVPSRNPMEKTHTATPEIATLLDKLEAGEISGDDAVGSLNA